jgi:hypothetical protein
VNLDSSVHLENIDLLEKRDLLGNRDLLEPEVRDLENLPLVVIRRSGLLFSQDLRVQVLVEEDVEDLLVRVPRPSKQKPHTIK